MLHPPRNHGDVFCERIPCLNIRENLSDPDPNPQGEQDCHGKRGFKLRLSDKTSVEN